MITIIPIEPINEAHGMLIVKAFNRFFVDKGGQQDGWSHSYGDMDGDGWSNYGDKIPEEWRAE